MIDLSVIIPCLNEAAKIKADIQAVQAFAQLHGLSCELIVVDDGSTDKTTEAVKSCQHDSELRVQVIRFETNYGKGHAVREGVLVSSGSIVVVMDSGLSVPLEYIQSGIEIIREEHCDFVWGSRKLPESQILIKQSIQRRIYSLLMQQLIYLLIGKKAGITDSQCGFKIYRGDIIRELISECRIDGYMFEIEILRLAMETECHICEFPIAWRWDRDTRLKPLGILWETMRDLFRILWGGRKDD